MAFNLNRRAVLGAGAGAAATLALAPRIGWTATSLPEINTMRSTAKSWLWLVEDYGNGGGFFEEAGIRVISNASNRGTNAASLQGGGVDILLGDPGESLRARAKDMKIRSIARMVNRYASHVVLRKSVLEAQGVTEASPEADKIAALRGLKLGTTGPGAAPDALFRYLASLGDMDPNRDFQLVPIQGGGPGVLAALDQKVIDGFCLSSPTADMAVLRNECDYLFLMTKNPPAALSPYQYIMATTGEETIAKRREDLVRYCRGLAMTQRAIRDEPEKFKTWALEFLGLPPEVADVAFDNNGSIYFEDPVPVADQMAANIDYINVVNTLMGAEALPDWLGFDTMVDPTLAQEAVKGL